MAQCSRGQCKVRLGVIGGGISGLASAFYLKRARPDLEVLVLERDRNPGGTARTDQVGPYLVDRGPNGFLTNVPETLELARDVGLESELVPAAAAASRRYLVREGRLVALPTTPWQFLKSPLLPPTAKLRVVLEPFAPAPPEEVDETVFAFAERRLGRAFAEAFVAPMVLGITAGDARQVSLASLFPRMKALEDRYGGLVRALLSRRRRRAASDGASRGGPAGPGGRLTSFRGGVGRLAEALRQHLGDDFLGGSEVVGLEAGDERRYRIVRVGAEPLEVDGAVLATPAFTSARLLGTLVPEIADDLEAIPYAGVRVLGLGYPAEAVPRALDGFGFLAARGHGVRALGCLWTSTLFPEQAPADRALLRVIGGGSLDPEFVTLSDDQALDLVRRDLRLTLGIGAEPDMVHHLRWERAIPQYLTGHGGRVERVLARVREHPGLALTGNAYHGVGLNDCVRDAHRVVRELTVPSG